MILIGYRHGLRASELCDLQWSQVELATGRLHVRRVKNGSPSVHPMQGDEIRALRRLQREQGPSSHVFMTERDGPMTPKAFHALFGRIGARAKIQFLVHPHMLRHGCGYALANAGHDTRALQAYLGHKNIQHTVRYSELAPDRFEGLLEVITTALTIAKARSPVALRRGRVIGTDCRLLPVLHVPSNNQEHEQGSSEDYPFVEMHEQSLPWLAALKSRPVRSRSRVDPVRSWPRLRSVARPL
jgi:Phage integrase family